MTAKTKIILWLIGAVVCFIGCYWISRDWREALFVTGIASIISAQSLF